MFFIGSINLNGQSDDLYFDEDEAEEVDNEGEQDTATSFIVDVDELVPYAEGDDHDESDNDDFDEYLDYQGQGFVIDAYGFTYRLSRLKLLGIAYREDITTLIF